jgi:ABC-type branched-subunit amino acid transport system permease subunit
VGISVPQVKLQAFGIAAFIAGVGGSLLAYEQLGGYLTSDSYGPIASLVLLTSVFIGGVSTVAGAIVAGVGSASGIVQYLVSSNLSKYGEWQALAGGVGLILVAVKQPDGVAGFNIEQYRELTAWIRRRRANSERTGDPNRKNAPALARTTAYSEARDATAVGTEL